MIDRTVIAQILTTLLAFAVFMWVFIKYFWQGISSAIEARQQYIEGKFSEITDRQNQLDEQQEEYNQRILTMEQEGEKLKQAEIARGRELVQQIEAEARQRGEDAMKQASERVELEIAKAREELRQEVVSIAITVAGRILKKEIDAVTQARLAAEFIGQVKELQKSEAEGRKSRE